MNEEPEKLERALALIIASTKTRRRPFSIAEISEAISYAKNQLSSIHALSDSVSLSAKMLRQFERFEDLSTETQELVRNRKIDSVDAVAHLSRLKPEDQDLVADRLASKSWDTSDVRAFLELRTAKPDDNTADLVAQVAQSKNIKEHVFEFIKRQGVDKEHVVDRVSSVVSRENVRGVDFEGSKGTLRLTPTGSEHLKRYSKANSIPLKNIVSYLLSNNDPSDSK